MALPASQSPSTRHKTAIRLTGDPITKTPTQLHHGNEHDTHLLSIRDVTPYTSYQTRNSKPISYCLFREK
ncbi:uncharacterized protein BP01DRAFT_355141 [Aspergillus saccharolyticus JOP 1030-1]|uniref:Uncharacterized protein n=1 Tax=Aspergillus saccharolyticus JOP 1030-1 TaxID=1450539 RepID=A0A318ZGS4_9EURO|nr:hypothetical protein BP01DRAFT_355141 [Aspergillus saccharolyticus JOP 1030-1]PYH46751.1 hypothetical protein BP01DRAFT_355141 [Aspergillus saccharolyticus JOP 1030-1]